VAELMRSEQPGSEAYDPDNLLDRHSNIETLEHHYALMQRRERELIDRRLGLSTGRVLSIGAGWHPGRHLFPAPAFELVAADADPAKVAGLIETGRADQAVVGYAGRLGLAAGSFDVVLYRLVLHHIAYKEPLAPCFDEAASLLAPGGALVAIEPGLWHPVGAGLAAANRIGLGTRVHGTPDDVPLSPRRLVGEARAARLDPELHTVTYAWRRMSPATQQAVAALDRPLGSRAFSARFGHTLMMIARSPEGA
jgi:SAM-dependent methyltransferase